MGLQVQHQSSRCLSRHRLSNKEWAADADRTHTHMHSVRGDSEHTKGQQVGAWQRKQATTVCARGYPGIPRCRRPGAVQVAVRYGMPSFSLKRSTGTSECTVAAVVHRPLSLPMCCVSDPNPRCGTILRTDALDGA